MYYLPAGELNRFGPDCRHQWVLGDGPPVSDELLHLPSLEVAPAGRRSRIKSAMVKRRTSRRAIHQVPYTNK